MNLKNLLIATTCCFGMTTALQAQLRAIGPAAGLSASDFSYAQPVDTLNSGTKAGGTGGIRFDFDLGVRWAKCTPEVFIIQNGAKEAYTSLSQFQSDVINRTVRLNYVGMYMPFTLYAPIKLNYMDQGGSWQRNHFGGLFNGFYATAAVYGDFIVNASISDSTSLPAPVQFRDKKDHYDAGYTVTGGFAIHGFTFRVGYSGGLKSIRFNSAIGGTADETYLVNNNGVIVAFGYTATFGPEEE